MIENGGNKGLKKHWGKFQIAVYIDVGNYRLIIEVGIAQLVNTSELKVPNLTLGEQSAFFNFFSDPCCLTDRALIERDKVKSTLSGSQMSSNKVAFSF